jgi:hypothetical protein
LFGKCTSLLARLSSTRSHLPQHVVFSSKAVTPSAIALDFVPRSCQQHYYTGPVAFKQQPHHITLEFLSFIRITLHDSVGFTSDTICLLLRTDSSPLLCKIPQISCISAPSSIVMSPRRKYVPAAEFAGLCQWSLTTTTGGSFDSLLAQTTGNGQTQQHSLQQQLEASDIASVQGSETQEQSTSTQTSQHSRVKPLRSQTTCRLLMEAKTRKRAIPREFSLSSRQSPCLATTRLSSEHAIMRGG